MLRRLLFRCTHRLDNNQSHQYLLSYRQCSSSSYPTVNELFSKSLTCSRVEYKGKKIFLIGDLTSDDLSLQRIEYTISKLKPALVCIEAENPYLGRDDNPLNKKDAKWRQPNPQGTLILDSYREMHSDYYPNLGTHLENYTPDNKQSHILQLRSICERGNIPMHYCGDELPDLMQRKSKMGQLEELTIQFREQFLREAKRAKEKRQRENPAAAQGRQQSTFHGAMEGLDEKEQQEHIELTRSVVDDLSNLTKMFENDKLMNAQQFKDMMNKCNQLKTIDDYELILDKSNVRNAGLNQTIRSLEMNFEQHAKDFWTAMLLLTVNRDRLLLRILSEQCEEMIKKEQDGVILGVFNLMHIYGIETMWKSTKFWKDEEVSREYVKEMADRDRVKEKLKEANAPFFGKNDPAESDDGLNEAIRFDR